MCLSDLGVRKEVEVCSLRFRGFLNTSRGYKPRKIILFIYLQGKHHNSKFHMSFERVEC